MNLKRDLFCVGALLLAIVTPSAADAAFVLSIDSISLTAGGAHGFVDVMGKWDGLGSNHLQVMATTFVITPPAGAGSSLKFTTYLDGSNGDHHFGDSDYVFDGVSADMLGAPPSSAGTVSPDGLSFSGGDGYHDPFSTLTPYVVLSTVPTLLYRFEVEASGAPVGTELFTLDLDPSAIFFGPEELIGFESSYGTISVSSGATAVPEPSSGLVFLLGVGLWTWRSRKRTQTDHS